MRKTWKKGSRKLCIAVNDKDKKLVGIASVTYDQEVEYKKVYKTLLDSIPKGLVPYGKAFIYIVDVRGVKMDGKKNGEEI